jgi:hypothetical protein
MKRNPYVAGSFYPSSKEKILSMFRDFESQLEDIGPLPNIRAIIAPHAGYVYSGMVAMAAYKAASSSKGKDITLLGPSHYYGFPDVLQCDFESWLSPLGETKCLPFKEIPISNDPFIPEHSLEVQLPFIQHVFKDIILHPLIVGDLQPGSQIKEQVDRLAKGLIVASSDLSHFLPYDDAVRKDKNTIGKILRLEDPDPEEACGKEPIKILLYMARKRKWKPKLIIYKNSGDTAGPRDSVVGYSAIAFTE